MKKANDAIILISVRLDKEVLQNFRMAISKKHKGVMRGTTFTEFNSALVHWTEIMNSEIDKRKGIRAPIFTPEQK